eukprot:s3491_g4.t1
MWQAFWREEAVPALPSDCVKELLEQEFCRLRAELVCETQGLLKQNLLECKKDFSEELLAFKTVLIKELNFKDHDTPEKSAWSAAVAVTRPSLLDMPLPCWCSWEREEMQVYRMNMHEEDGNENEQTPHTCGALEIEEQYAGRWEELRSTAVEAPPSAQAAPLLASLALPVQPRGLPTPPDMSSGEASIAVASTCGKSLCVRCVRTPPDMSSGEELEDIGELEERYPYDVYLYMYDITDGWACRYSPLLLGQRLRALYHTGIVVRWLDGDLEYWFGGRIQTESAGRTPYGEPLDKRFMGKTLRTREEIGAFLELSSSTFVPDSYDIAFHNCNSFSAAMLEFLCDMQLPPDVVEQPGVVLNTYTGYLGYQLWKTLSRWDAARPRLPGA